MYLNWKNNTYIYHATIWFAAFLFLTDVYILCIFSAFKFFYNFIFKSLKWNFWRKAFIQKLSILLILAILQILYNTKLFLILLSPTHPVLASLAFCTIWCKNLLFCFFWHLKQHTSTSRFNLMWNLSWNLIFRSMLTPPSFSPLLG